MTTLAYVDGDGVPTVMNTLDAIADYMSRYYFHLFGAGPQNTMRDTVANGGTYRLFHDQSDTRPILAAVAPVPKTGLDALVNAHIGPGRSADYLAQATQAWQAQDGDRPRVGDVYTDPQGVQSRFSYAWGEGIQVGGGSHGFSISRHGGVSYSGSVKPPRPKGRGFASLGTRVRHRG